MMKLRITAFAALVWLAGAFSAFAQTSPGFTFGQVPTVAQWNSYFSGKQDYLGAPPCIVTGCTYTGKITTTASSTSGAGLNLPAGAAPTSPLDGDIWTTTGGMFVRINGVTIGPLSGATSSSFAATSPITLSFPAGVVTYACPTCGVTGSPLSQFASTTSAQLLGVISDETGTGSLVFANTPTLVTPVLGVATATSINKVVITPPATSATLTIANGKTLTASNSLTFTGTDSTSFAFPGSSDTVVTLGATQTLTAKTLTATSNVLGGVTMTLGSDATGDIYYRNSSGFLTRLPIGTNGFVLQVNSGLPSWQTAGSASSITVGSTAVNSCGTSGGNLFNNAGTLGCRPVGVTYQLLTASSGTYTVTSASVTSIEVYMLGGSGGGGATGTAGGTSPGGAGGDTCWKTSGAACSTPDYKATGGSGGAAVTAAGTGNGGVGGNGGASGGGTLTPASSSTGTDGGWGSPGQTSSFSGRGGKGGMSSCGDGLSAAGGDGGTGSSGAGGGGGGGGGACTFFVINTPAGTYTFANGAAGTAGVAGTGGNAGIIGLAGKILVVERYN